MEAAPRTVATKSCMDGCGLQCDAAPWSTGSLVTPCFFMRAVTPLVSMPLFTLYTTFGGPPYALGALSNFGMLYRAYGAERRGIARCRGSAGAPFRRREQGEGNRFSCVAATPLTSACDEEAEEKLLPRGCGFAMSRGRFAWASLCFLSMSRRESDNMLGSHAASDTRRGAGSGATLEA